MKHTLIKNNQELNETLMWIAEATVTSTMIKAYNVIHSFVEEFYKEYSPVQYERTYQMLNDALNISPIKKNSHGYEVFVYFDYTNLNYYLVEEDSYGAMNVSTYDSQEILNTVMSSQYPHGGYKGAPSTGLWTRIQPVIKSDAIDWLLTELKGLGVKII